MWRFRGTPYYLDAQGDRLGLSKVLTDRARHNPEVYRVSVLLGQLCERYQRARKKEGRPWSSPRSWRRSGARSVSASRSWRSSTPWRRPRRRWSTRRTRRSGWTSRSDTSASSAISTICRTRQT